MFRIRKRLSKLCPEIGNILNIMIDNLPINLTFPYFNHCGPSGKTKHKIKLKPTCLLDQYCLKHDEFYEKYLKANKRRNADILLSKQARQRFLANDSSLYEKCVALIIWYVMKLKVVVTITKNKKNNKRSFKASRILRTYQT